MAVIDELKILVKAEVDSAIAALQKTESQSNKTGLSFAKLRDMMQGPVAAGKEVIAAFQKIKAVSDKMEAAWSIQEQAVAVLNSTLKATGDAAGLSSKEIQDLASEFQSFTKYGDETVLAMESVLLGFKNIKGDNFKDASLQILNMATVMKMDLTSAAQAVGKALDDPITGIDSLSRQGFKFSKEQKEMLKQMVETGRIADAQGIILDELATTFGGAAEAAGQTGSAIKERLNNAIGDLNEQIGRSITNNLKPWREKWLQMAEAIGAAVKAQNDFKEAIETPEETRTAEQRIDILSRERKELEAYVSELETKAIYAIDAGKASSDAAEEELRLAKNKLASIKQELVYLEQARISNERGGEASKKRADEQERLAKIEEERRKKDATALQLYDDAINAVRNLEREEQARQDIMGDLVDYQALSNAAYDEARKLITESNGLITEANPLYKELVQLAIDYKNAARDTSVELEDSADSAEELSGYVEDITNKAYSLSSAWGEWNIQLGDSLLYLDDLAGAASAVWDSARDTADAYFDLVQNGYDAEIAAMEASGATDEEIQAKKNEQAQKMFNANKVTSIADALINGAVAVTKALAELGPIAGPIAAGVITGLTGTQVAAIAAQQYVPFAQGGIVNGPTHALIGEAGPEAIIPLRDMVSGGSSKTINVYQNVAGSIWNTRQLQGLAVGAVKSASRGY